MLVKRGIRPRSKLIKSIIREEIVKKTGMRGIWDEEMGSFLQDHKYCYEKIEPAVREHFSEGGGDGVMIIAGLCNTTHATVQRWMQPDHKLYKKDFHELIEECRGKAVIETDKWHRESANGERPKANAATLNRRAEKVLDMVPVMKTLNKLEDLNEIDAQIDRIRELQAQYGESGSPNNPEE